MKTMLLASVSALAFNSQFPETMLVKRKGSSDPVMINRADFNDKLETEYTKDDGSTAAAGAAVRHAGGAPTVAPGVTIPPPASTPGFGLTPPANPGDAPQQTVPTPSQAGVLKKGKKFIVVDLAGQPYANEGYDKAGYDSEQDAWNAIYAVQAAAQGQILPTPAPASGTLPPAVSTN